MPDAVETAEKAVTKDVKGLPVWAWGAILAGGGFVVYVLFFKGSGESAGVTTWPASSGVGSGGSGGGSTGTGGGGTVTPVPAIERSNLQWLTDALGTVPMALAIDPAIVRVYLEQYLNGVRPVGSAAAISQYDRVIRSAIESAGQVPTKPQMAGSANPFASNISWVQNALGFVPSGTPGSVRQELIHLFNGTTDTLSPAAEDLLNSLRSVIGFEPQPVTYNVPKPVVPALPVPPVAPPVAPPPVAPPPVAPVAPVAPAFKSFGEAIYRLASGIDVRVRRIGPVTTQGFLVDLADTVSWQPFSTAIMDMQGNFFKDGVKLGQVNQKNIISLVSDEPPKPKAA